MTELAQQVSLVKCSEAGKLLDEITQATPKSPEVKPIFEAFKTIANLICSSDAEGMTKACEEIKKLSECPKLISANKHLAYIISSLAARASKIVGVVQKPMKIPPKAYKYSSKRREFAGYCDEKLTIDKPEVEGSSMQESIVFINTKSTDYTVNTVTKMLEITEGDHCKIVSTGKCIGGVTLYQTKNSDVILFVRLK